MEIINWLRGFFAGLRWDDGSVMAVTRDELDSMQDVEKEPRHD